MKILSGFFCNLLSIFLLRVPSVTIASELYHAAANCYFFFLFSFFDFHFSAYEGTEPVEFSRDELLKVADAIRTGVQRKLRSQSAAAEVVKCRRDVLLSLFPEREQMKKFTAGKEDFPEQFFPPGWDAVINVHGQGQTVHYPITLKPTVRHSPCTYVRNADGNLVEGKRCTVPFVSLQFVNVQAHI